MSAREQFIAWALGLGAAALPLIVGGIRLMITKLSLLQIDLDAAKEKRLREVATDAAHYAQEVYAAGKLAGSIAVVDRSKLAGDLVADKFEHMTRDDIDVAVKSAVGADPTLGASAVLAKNGSHS